MLLDVVDGRHQLARLGRQGRVEAGEELLGGDQAEITALDGDGDRRGERRGELSGRHGGGGWSRGRLDGLVKVCLRWTGSAPLDENRAGNEEGWLPLEEGTSDCSNE